MPILLAVFHYLAILGLFACLFAELILLNLESSPTTLRALGRVDIGYGSLSGVVILSGLLRVFLGETPATAWLANPAFWTKMGLFLAIGLISVIPTLRFLGWRKAAKASGQLPDIVARKPIRNLVVLQIVLFAGLPLFAVLMAPA